MSDASPALTQKKCLVPARRPLPWGMPLHDGTTINPTFLIHCSKPAVAAWCRLPCKREMLVKLRTLLMETMRSHQAGLSATSGSAERHRYASRRSWSVHAAAAGVIARRGQKLTECLPRAGTTIRVSIRDGHHALDLPKRKIRDSRVTAWCGVHPA
jgi:hypothetical protein